MSRIQTFMARRAGTVGAVAAVVLYVAVGARAQSQAAGETSAPGRIDFEAVDLPAPTVEIDLSQGMVHDLFGIGDAAAAGVAESLLKSSETGTGNEATRLAAEKLAAARQIVQLVSEVVQEARIRVYKGAPDDSMKPETLAARFDSQLRAGNWENVVQVRENEQSVRVSLLRNKGAVQGIFLVAGQHGKEVVLANVVCDVSPENIKKLTSVATKIGLENGLAQAIEAKMSKRHKFGPPAPAQPPRPNP